VNLHEKEQLRLRLSRLAWLMDNSIPIPGGAKIGIDPLIGLIPWVGDLLGALVSSFILSEAARLGLPKSVLVKMAFNTSLDALIGAVPFVGDLFDFAWKANMRNVRLLEEYLERPRATVITSRLFVAFLCLLVIAVVVLIGMLGFLLVRWIWQAVGG
jgi:NAD/NADP transhydrogenase beta subunit